MCQYWKKQYTCGHFSNLFLDMCRPGRVANRVCPDMSDEYESRKSYFLCFDCIRQEARSEYEAQARAAHEAAMKARESQQQVLREKQLAEHRAKEERIRREARDKAAREREEEAKAKLLMEEEQERVKKEGGLWIETGSGRKGRHRRNAPGLGPPILSANHSPVRNIFSRDRKENEGGLGSSSQNDGKRLDATGRAGVWGPKKILTRSDNNGKNENAQVKK